MTDAAEHFDVLIVGAGLSGIGAGYHLQQKCPGKSYVILEGRDCIGGTWDLFRYPGIRSDSDMYTLGYSFKPWTEPKAIADGPRILNYVRETAVDNGIDKQHPLPPPRQTRVVVVAGGALDGGGRAHGGRGRDRDRALHLQFPVHVLGLLQIRGRLYAGIFRRGRLRRPDRASAEVARGSRLCRQARGGDRLGRDRRDAGAGNGQDRGARHHAAALADLCGGAAGGGCARQQAAQESLGQARLSPDPLAQRAVRHVFLPALPAQAGSRQAVDPRRRQDGAGAGIRRRQAFYAALQSVGAAALPGARRRPVQVDPRQARLRRHQRDRHLHQRRHQARRTAASSRPTSSSPRPG